MITNNSRGRNYKTLSLVVIKLIPYDLILTKVRKKVIIPFIVLKLAL